jgi:DnaJ-class molecular chaperone
MKISTPQHRKLIEEHSIDIEKNNQIFNKSYFGKLKQKRMNTPENKISPDDGKEKEKCIACNGTGSVIVWNKDDDGDEEPEREECKVCEGTGEVDEDNEPEW